MDQSTDLSSLPDEDLLVGSAKLTDTNAHPLPSSTQPPPSSSPVGRGFGLRDGPPHGATASSAERHRMMAFTSRAISPQATVPLPSMPVPDPSLDNNDHLQGPHAHAAHSTQTPDPGLVPHPTLQPSSLQSAPDWFLLDSSAPGLAAPFLQPVDPFLAPSESNIANLALGIHGHDFHYSEQTHDGAILPHHLPLTDPSSAINFDFNFPLPQWEPSFADGAPLPNIIPDEAPTFTSLRRTGTDHAMGLEAFAPEMSWFEADPASSTTDHRSSRSLTAPTPTPAPAPAARKRTKKDKGRTNSTASGSAYSASVASTQDAFPFPEPVSNPSNPLNPSSSQNNERRRSNRSKGRARSVATTTSASSSSTAPTPSVSGTRSQPPGAAAAAARPPEQTTNPATSASRLRSASRASKNSISRPSDTAEERRTRASHNLVEKQYRNRLNAQFEGLLGILPDPDASQAKEIKTEGGAGTAAAPADTEQDPVDKKVSKAEVLERARVHIETLERQSEALARQREALLDSLVKAEREMASSGGGAVQGLLDDVDDGEEFPLERWEMKRDTEPKDDVVGKKS